MPPSELVKYYLASDVLEVGGLRNSVTGAYLNSGVTADVTLVDSLGVEVVRSAGTWPQTLAYVASSDGIYRTTLDGAGLTLSPGDWYKAKLSIDAGGGLEDYRELPVEVVIKGAND